MPHKSINDQLTTLYAQQLEKLTYNDLPDKDVDGTLLMHCWEEDYLSARHKILFVGQEANGWMGDFVNSVDECLKSKS